LDEAVARERLAHTEGHQTVFREAEVEEGGHISGSRAQLLLLLHKVGTADLSNVLEGGGGCVGWNWKTDVANGALVTETREQLKHFRLDGLVKRSLVNWVEMGVGIGGTHSASLGEGLVHVKETNGVLERTTLQGRIDSSGSSHIDCTKIQRRV